LDQYSLARNDRAGHVQALPRRQCSNGHGRRSDVVEGLGSRRQVGLVDGHQVGVRVQTTQRAHDTVTGLEAGHARANGFHDASEFEAKHRGQLQREDIANVAFANPGRCMSARCQQHDRSRA